MSEVSIWIFQQSSLWQTMISGKMLLNRTANQRLAFSNSTNLVVQHSLLRINRLIDFKYTINRRNLSSFIECNSKCHQTARLEKLNEVLSSFKAPIRYAVAYGSSVFSQGCNSINQNTQTDFIFGVTHPEHWHSLNLRYNPNHYSSLARYAGSNIVSKVQSNYGGNIYFNTHVKFADETIKYGVVSIDDLMKDCVDWNTMYLAGRFQKPVLILRDDARVSLARRKNFRSAVRTALFLLPETFTEYELYSTIVKLSYMGDIRMLVGGENPNKVDNIVNNQFYLLRNIYLPIIDDLQDCNIVESTITPTIRQALDNSDHVPQYEEGGKLKPSDAKGVLITKNINDSDLKHQLFLKLPKSLQIAVKNECRIVYNKHFDGLLKTEPGSKEEILVLVDNKNSEQLAKCVEHSVKEIVGWPSTIQTIKGIFSAGPVNSVYYALEKLKKGVLRK